MTVLTGARPTGDAGGTRAEFVYREVRRQIGSGALRPGQKITERGLADELSVSPTPVREAIRRLEQDGLIERLRPRTVVITDMQERAIDDLAEVEVALRGLVARFAARHATPEQLDRLDAILDEADDQLIVLTTRYRNGEDVERHVTALLDLMQDFNDALEACANNPVLVRLLAQSRVFSRPERRARLLEEIAADGSFGLDRYGSHRALVRALRAGDAATAEELDNADAQGGLDALRARNRDRRS
ncbi:DNA-binding transcriptional regulator, GntR family [Blastococcus aurantiacus]|uniref:DNA-binding transcriptional regulator, GntR family n=1 Tax=Blastococcus aurantiacus TaxID=1550231 RepID=A0A1G7HX92_9ACTN|nr:GntR family transcriptional regulator [Blastococcus aurantiacus]SDF05120.1 DNA-binding transcriptional regulator, GntR family [Blastococcus aurantiacus]